jgi:hypothetical protein
MKEESYNRILKSEHGEMPHAESYNGATTGWATVGPHDNWNARFYGALRHIEHKTTAHPENRRRPSPQAKSETSSGSLWWNSRARRARAQGRAVDASATSRCRSMDWVRRRRLKGGFHGESRNRGDTREAGRGASAFARGSLGTRAHRVPHGPTTSTGE